MTARTLYRGMVFRAEHDSTYDFWGGEQPRNKLCLVFNAAPVSEGEDVHYFLTTLQGIAKHLLFCQMC
jgi:hypothetical protein